MLVERWNAAPRTLPIIGDRDPNIIENWYYAVWAYNKWTAANNPNNPDLPWPRPAFTGKENRTNYPYQELVWGLAANPPSVAGQPMWEPVALALPGREDVGLTPRALAQIEPPHRSVCAAPPTTPAVPAAKPGLWKIALPWVTRTYGR